MDRVLLSVSHSGSLPNTSLCHTVFMAVVLGGGSTDRWWDVGPFVGLLLVSSGGLPAWGHFVILLFGVW